MTNYYYERPPTILDSWSYPREMTEAPMKSCAHIRFARNRHALINHLRAKFIDTSSHLFLSLAV